YTCGARWRTCSCTEEDQIQRATRISENLQRLDAETRAEEEEIRAAIAAVEAAEQQAAEARREEEQRQEEERAEEARRITMLEYQRVEKIVQHYNRLRDIMVNIHSAQPNALTQRHDQGTQNLEKKETTLLLVGKGDSETNNDDIERVKIITTTDAKITQLRKNHTSVLIQTRARHRHDEDSFILSIAEPSTPSPPHQNEDTEIDAATKLETLLSAQELERSTLRSIQAREIEKWKKRGAYRLQTLEREEEKRADEREREVESLREETKRVKRVQWAEWKWMDVLREERVRLLREDERTIMLNGGEVEVGLGLGEDVEAEAEAEVNGGTEGRVPGAFLMPLLNGEYISVGIDVTTPRRY
ncbi:MAG: hypothetical protein L6R42_007042, partial [Xanthoria sp. 1 TBL-2021]